MLLKWKWFQNAMDRHWKKRVLCRRCSIWTALRYIFVLIHWKNSIVIDLQPIIALINGYYNCNVCDVILALSKNLAKETFVKRRDSSFNSLFCFEVFYDYLTLNSQLKYIWIHYVKWCLKYCVSLLLVV